MYNRGGGRRGGVGLHGERQGGGGGGRRGLETIHHTKYNNNDHKHSGARAIRNRKCAWRRSLYKVNVLVSNTALQRTTGRDRTCHVPSQVC